MSFYCPIVVTAMAKMCSSDIDWLNADILMHRSSTSSTKKTRRM